MNKIKFRIWDKKDECWHVSPNEHKIGVNSFYEEIGENTVSRYSVDGDGLIFQLFTGLLDKNDKEIYEGDVLQIPQEEVKNCIHSPYGHVWYSDIFGNWFVSYNHMYSEMSDDLYRRIHDSEVIGNIFENPELLKS